MNIKVHVQGIKGSGMIEEGEQAAVLFNGVLEVDGVLIEEATDIEVVFSGGKMTAVKARLLPGAFEVVTHTKESWPELLRSLDEIRTARSGTDRLIAKSG